MTKLIYILTIFFVFFYQNGNAQDQLPSVADGHIERITDLKSHYVSQRIIDVWLPAGYSPSERYPVLYMHDGQMLFDPAQAWNKQAWDVDDAASKLFAEGNIRKFIVVGIWNSGEGRHADYFPQKPFESLTKAEKDTVRAQLQRDGRAKNGFKPQSDNYLKFIVKELKPYIDSHFPVLRDRQNTFVAGSSMGGLISMYALCEYPDTFGGAACLSTHWPGTFVLQNNPMPRSFLAYLRKKLPDPKCHKFYFDCGDQTLDALYPDIQKQADTIIMARGYDKTNWLTCYFPGQNHSEQAWAKRLHVPLIFLFGENK